MGTPNAGCSARDSSTHSPRLAPRAGFSLSQRNMPRPETEAQVPTCFTGSEVLETLLPWPRSRTGASPAPALSWASFSILDPHLMLKPSRSPLEVEAIIMPISRRRMRRLREGHHGPESHSQ